MCGLCRVALSTVHPIAGHWLSSGFPSSDRRVDFGRAPPADRHRDLPVHARVPVRHRRGGGAGQRLPEGLRRGAKIGPAVDRFFTEVFVMADDPTLRTARLRLMQQVEQVILQLADVSEIVREK